MGRYTRQFRQEAIQLVTEQGYRPSEAARKLGIPHSTFEKWINNSGWKKPDPQPLSDDPKVLQVQLRETQAQLKRLQMENEILKKATAYFASQNV